jgi:membrane protease YdiL (CAAX protease family)
MLILFVLPPSEGKFLSSPENPQFGTPPLNTEPQTVPLVVDPFPPPTFLPAAPAPKAGENPVWSGWDVLLMGGLTVVTLFVAQVIIVFGARHFFYPRQDWLDVALKPKLAMLSELVTYAFVGLYMFLLVEGKYRVRFWQAIRWNWPGFTGISFMGLGVLMLSFDYLGARFLPMPKTTPFDQFFNRPSDAYLVAAFAITLGPLMEELFFRGFLYPVLARRTGAVSGIVITGLLFGLIHSPQYGNSWAAVLIVCMVGVVLTAVRAVTKSVASSFLAHVGYNGILLLLTAWATDGFRHMEKAVVLLGFAK